MRRFAILAVLFAAGCGAPEPVPEPGPAAPGPGPDAAGARAVEIRGRIALQKEELRRQDVELGKIAAERLQLEAQPASEAKTNRLAELTRLEADTRARRKALEEEIAALERQAQEAGGPARAASADEALDQALAAEAQRKEEEQRRIRAAAEASSERKRLEEAGKALAAERAAREREKIQPSAAGPSAPAGEERPLFEERYAAQILRLKMELQRFKRW